ncbi:MAG: hypothetical protein AAFV53_14565 [Myxococcota bacterium]
MMELFEDALLEDVRRLPGARHSFLKQLAGADGRPIRVRMQAVAAAAGEDVVIRWQELLNTLDNPRFFQGFSEVQLCERLFYAGWSVIELGWPGPIIRVRSPHGKSFNLIVLSFIRQLRPRPDLETLKKLVRTLNRANARSRIGVHVQRWLPHDFDPEPIRRAIEMWLRDVQHHNGADRYAVYSDEFVSLEFALTDEQATGEQDVVAFSVGPLSSQRTLEIVQRQISAELEQYRMGPLGAEPVLLACVTQVPWQLSRGWIRAFLYGQAVWQATMGDPPRFEAGFSETPEPSLFRDPLYRSLSGVLFLDRSIIGRDFRAKGYRNPWARHRLLPGSLPFPSLGLIRLDASERVIGWSASR